MTIASESTTRASRRALHLLWTVPLAIVLSVPLLLLGGLQLCGVSGCGGGGFGPAYGADWEWIAPYALIGLLLFLAVALVPWSRPVVRVVVAVVLAVIVAGLLIAAGFDAKYPLIER